MDRINALCQSLGAKQAALTRTQSDGEKIIDARFVVCELLAKMLKPHAEEAFVKGYLIAAAELFVPNKVLTSGESAYKFPEA